MSLVAEQRQCPQVDETEWLGLLRVLCHLIYTRKQSAFVELFEADGVMCGNFCWAGSVGGGLVVVGP